MQRRLAAILAMDVVGYSRLMGQDEAATLVALRAHRQELISRLPYFSMRPEHSARVDWWSRESFAKLMAFLLRKTLKP